MRFRPPPHFTNSRKHLSIYSMVTVLQTSRRAAFQAKANFRLGGSNFTKQCHHQRKRFRIISNRLVSWELFVCARLCCWQDILRGHSKTGIAKMNAPDRYVHWSLVLLLSSMLGCWRWICLGSVEREGADI
jgi:hypothetical protein